MAAIFFFAEALKHYTETVRHTLLFTSKPATVGADLLTGLARFHPLEFARAPNGYVYMATGLDPVVKWDGVDRDIMTVGVAAPEDEPTLSFTGPGEIVGDYACYVRYIDEDGNVSNLSPTSETVEARSMTT